MYGQASAHSPASEAPVAWGVVLHFVIDIVLGGRGDDSGRATHGDVCGDGGSGQLWLQVSEARRVQSAARWCVGMLANASREWARSTDKAVDQHAQ
jgi:hypothetical protein